MTVPEAAHLRRVASAQDAVVLEVWWAPRDGNSWISAFLLEPCRHSRAQPMVWMRMRASEPRHTSSSLGELCVTPTVKLCRQRRDSAETVCARDVHEVLVRSERRSNGVYLRWRCERMELTKYAGEKFCIVEDGVAMPADKGSLRHARWECVREPQPLRQNGCGSRDPTFGALSEKPSGNDATKFAYDPSEGSRVPTEPTIPLKFAKAHGIEDHALDGGTH